MNSSLAKSSSKYFHSKTAQTKILSPASLSLPLSLSPSISLPLSISLEAAHGSTARLIVLTDGVSFGSLLYLPGVAPLQLPLLTWQLANLNVVVDVVDNECRQF